MPGGTKGADETERPRLLPNEETVRSSSPIGGNEFDAFMLGAVEIGGEGRVFRDCWLLGFGTVLASDGKSVSPPTEGMDFAVPAEGVSLRGTGAFNDAGSDDTDDWET